VEVDEDIILDSLSQNIDKSFKRMLSISNESTELGSKKTTTQRINTGKSSSNIFDICAFEERIPNWCARIVDRNNNDLGFKITNTCTIDNFLLAFWVSSQLNNSILNLCSRNDLLDIINSFQHIEWNKAKSIWLQEFIYCSEFDFGCRCSECEFSLKTFKINKTVDTFDSEYEYFLHPIIYFLKYNLFSCCSNDCSSNNKLKQSISFLFVKVNSLVSLTYAKEKRGKSCNNEIRIDVSFQSSLRGYLFKQVVKLLYMLMNYQI
jgi:hypothetical protein